MQADSTYEEMLEQSVQHFKDCFAANSSLVQGVQQSWAEFTSFVYEHLENTTLLNKFNETIQESAKLNFN